MTFWAALKEAFLEMLIGSRQLAAWRAERKQREECERVFRMHMDSYYLASKPTFLPK